MKFFNPFVRVSDEQVLREFEPWNLYCAVSAANGTLSVGHTLDLELWLRLCQDTFIQRVAKSAGVSNSRATCVLRNFAKNNRHREMELGLALEERPL